jgi:glucokinase
VTDISNEHRVVLTLDAGGTNLRFCGMRAGRQVTDMVTLDTHGDNLELCLDSIVGGFNRVRAMCPVPPVAISFAFPGPADYPRGIIGDLGNLTGFRGGVALGPMLEDKFKIPVFINNDGDLFAYGEAIAGLLPHVNGLLEKAGSPKRYRNLFGVTLGTGLGGGIVRNGELFIGDNSSAGEIWRLRHKLDTKMNVEEGACIRAVRRVYAQQAGISINSAPDPKVIEQVAFDEKAAYCEAAVETYRRVGEVVGDALGNVLTLVDGLVVIGGGISKGWRLFLPRLVDELNSSYTKPNGYKFRRLGPVVFNLEDTEQLGIFLRGDLREVVVPGSNRKVKYDPLARLGVGITRLGTSEAVAVGAYAFALNELQKKN